MCGIFAYTGKSAPIDHLLKLALANERERGGHAFGWAWINSEGRIRSFKSPGKLEGNKNAIEMLTGAVAVIGHLRYSTTGKPECNINNHPHHCDGGWIAHNGTLAKPLFAMSTFLDVSSNCDSEVLARLIEVLPGRRMSDRFGAAMKMLGENHAALGIWKPGRILAMTTGKPLFRAESNDGTIVSSTATGLTKAVRIETRKIQILSI